MTFLAYFILLYTVGNARGEDRKVLAQVAPSSSSGTKEILDESEFDMELDESIFDMEEDESIFDMEEDESEFDMEEEPSPIQEVKEPSDLETKETEQFSDTCSQLRQFYFLDNVIRIAGFSAYLPPDIQTLPREQAFEVIKGILIQQGYSLFAHWNNDRAVKKEWFVDFLYFLLEKDELAPPEKSFEKRLKTIELTGYISDTWTKEDCACSEDFINAINDIVFVGIFNANSPREKKSFHPNLQKDQIELLETDLINIITNATGLSKRIYMSRQWISAEAFCNVQRELLINSAYTEFAGFDCKSYVSKDWYINFVYDLLQKELELETGFYSTEARAAKLIELNLLPPTTPYQQNIYEGDIYWVINNPVFITSLNASRQQKNIVVTQDTSPKLPNVYEEPLSPVR